MSSPRDGLSEETKKIIKGIRLTFREDKDKYSKRRLVRVYKGYDAFQNFLLVRRYIYARYGVNIGVLEVLIMLMGMKVFIREDYRKIPKDYNICRFDSLKEKGYITKIVSNNNADLEAYELSVKARHIVIDFYKCMSGEKEIPYEQLSKSKTTKNIKAADLIKELQEYDPKPQTGLFI